jgi:16S rRNA G527 N7-methylase RsmG
MPEPLEADRARALALTPVSRETLQRLDRFVALLLTWQQHTNLIATSTVPHLWTRHVADSLQLLDIAPDARIWIDLGSGGGFPGLVIACALADVSGACVHLVESTGKKAAFLREAVRLTGAAAHIHTVRIEDADTSVTKTHGAAGHVESDLALPAAVTLRAWAGAYDLDLEDADRRFEQWGIASDWTPLPGLQLRLSYRRKAGPASAPGSSDDEILGEAHLYF